ncbi:DUF6515 family protein [Mucilaginibacter ginkgonis]|uniref:Uncharacterized protein n=1 Tax=Mucilaginibacter ginkgonis TaxID=2682091 RepID=A0A6I4INK9_9SPHI|nr:DUF6515 family protein [Mucilaginibacter ginkgonis]QQL49710.1 hypothetical protein GO620_016305 [Mucilaginibacter ginkgonis]
MKTFSSSIFKIGLAMLIMFAISTTTMAQRGGRGGGGFRGSVGIRGGFGGGYRGGFGYGGPRVGVGFGYGGFRSYPRVGLSIGVLPYGYYPFSWGGNPYFYYGGAFYAPYGSSYQVVAPPVGAEVPSLPSGAKPINIDGVQYYEFNGVYYKEAITPDNKKVYVVSGKDGVLNTNADGTVSPDVTVDQPQDQMPHVGDMTDKLPDGSRKVSLNGKRYWITPEDIYLEEVKTDNGTSYRVVSVPGNEQ